MKFYATSMLEIIEKQNAQIRNFSYFVWLYENTLSRISPLWQPTLADYTSCKLLSVNIFYKNAQLLIQIYLVYEKKKKIEPNSH